MRQQELEKKIADYILEIYKAEYIGLLNVFKDDDIYSLHIGIPSYMMPTKLSGQFDNDNQFLDYIYEELRKRNYMRIYFYKVERNKNSIEE